MRTQFYDSLRNCGMSLLLIFTELVRSWCNI